MEGDEGRAAEVLPVLQALTTAVEKCLSEEQETLGKVSCWTISIYNYVYRKIRSNGRLDTLRIIMSLFEGSVCKLWLV